MNKTFFNSSSRRLFGLILLVALFASAFLTILIYAQEAPQAQASRDDAEKKKKRPGTAVVNAQELPVDATPAMMEVFRISLGVECAYCHVSGEFLEHGHNGDRQSDFNPRKLIARDMIKMTKEINGGITGNSNFPDPSNVVTCWTCHRGSRRPSVSAPTPVSNPGPTAAVGN